MGDKEDIDYNLTFPPAVYSGEIEPVVFLLGWVGSLDKHLAKYSAIYEKEGCITIRYIHPHKSVFLTDPNDSSDHARASVKLVQLLEDYDLMDNPVFVHVFSNGGYFVYTSLADTLLKKEVKVAGVIFDSCPSHLNWWVGVQAILHSNIFPNMLLTYLTTILFSVYFFIFHLKSLLGFRRTVNVFEKMKQSPLHIWPHLYLYSSADVIIPFKHIEEMAEGRLRAGVSLMVKHNFVSSPHVLHYRQFPDVYKKICVEFVHKALGVVSNNKPDDKFNRV